MPGRFITMTAETARPPAVEPDLRDFMDSIGASEILIVTSDKFLSATFMVHGSYSTDEGVKGLANKLRKLLGALLCREILITSESQTTGSQQEIITT